MLFNADYIVEQFNIALLTSNGKTTKRNKVGWLAMKNAAKHTHNRLKYK